MNTLCCEGIQNCLVLPLVTDPTLIVSQAYDGASVMSGRCSGIQKHIKEVAPEATYIRCYAHCLNLALVDSTKHVSEAAEFFALMETLYVLLSSA